MAQYAVSSDELREIARKLRVESLKKVYKAKSGHCGGPLSAADIMAVLYWRFMNIRPEDPKWPDRDRFVLSKGHSCPVLYTALAFKGYFDRSHYRSHRSGDRLFFVPSRRGPAARISRMAQIWRTQGGTGTVGPSPGCQGTRIYCLDIGHALFECFGDLEG